MGTTEFILLVILAAILDLIIILWLLKRSRTTESSVKKDKAGIQSQVIDRLKYEGDAKAQEKARPDIGEERDNGHLP